MILLEIDVGIIIMYTSLLTFEIYIDIFLIPSVLRERTTSLLALNNVWYNIMSIVFPFTDPQNRRKVNLCMPLVLQVQHLRLLQLILLSIFRQILMTSMTGLQSYSELHLFCAPYCDKKDCCACK